MRKNLFKEVNMESIADKFKLKKQKLYKLVSGKKFKGEEVTKNENVKGIKEEKEVMRNVEITEPLKDEYEEASGEQKDVTEESAEFKVTEIIKDEKEEMKEEQDDMVEK